MVSNNPGGGNFYIHGTRLVTPFAVDAAGLVTPQGDYPKKIGQPQYGPIGTGILAERPLHQKRESHYQPQNDKAGNGDLAGPEVKQGKVRINTLKNQLPRPGGHIDNPGQKQIPQIPEPSVHFRRDHPVVFSFEYFFSQLSYKLLKGSKGTNPSAEKRPQKEGGGKYRGHENQARFVNLFDKGAGGGKGIYAYYPAEGTYSVQGGGTEKRESSAPLNQGMIHRYKGDKQEKKQLHPEPERPLFLHGGSFIIGFSFIMVHKYERNVNLPCIIILRLPFLSNPNILFIKE
jgi:hypothetical protein